MTAFAVFMAATGSIFVSALATLGSVFPDSVEHFLWGEGRNRHHRRSSHWFAIYLAGFGLCYYVWGDATLPTLASLFRAFADRSWPVLFSCGAFWFLGGLVHVLCDACCGKVPLLIPWKKTFGRKFFTMSGAYGEMSRGESIFTGFIVLSCLCAWLNRFGVDILHM